jgi:hypothetical protein
MIIQSQRKFTTSRLCSAEAFKQGARTLGLLGHRLRLEQLSGKPTLDQLRIV